MLGDFVEKSLKRVGVSQERVERWLGQPCGCQERKEKLNSLHAWARKTSQSAVDTALGWLDRILSDHH